LTGQGARQVGHDAGLAHMRFAANHGNHA